MLRKERRRNRRKKRREKGEDGVGDRRRRKSGDDDDPLASDSSGKLEANAHNASGDDAGASSSASAGSSSSPSSSVSSESDGIYRLGNRLGKGAYGVVYQAIHRTKGNTVAIKQLNIGDVPAETQHTLEMEVKLLKKLSHPNIVRYVDHFVSNGQLNIVMEFVENGSLASMVNQYGTFTEPLCKAYIRGVLEGLVYLHSEGVVHRDIKGGNILITTDGTVKLADFGVSQSMSDAKNDEDEDEKTPAGTPYYMAPEVIQFLGAQPVSDVWSVGCTIIELLTGDPPYGKLDPFSAMYKMVQEGVKIPGGISSALRDFLAKCFQSDPNFRVSASELLKHPWIRPKRATNDSDRQHLPAAASAVREIEEQAKRVVDVRRAVEAEVKYFGTLTMSDAERLRDVGIASAQSSAAAAKSPAASPRGANKNNNSSPSPLSSPRANVGDDVDIDAPPLSDEDWSNEFGGAAEEVAIKQQQQQQQRNRRDNQKPIELDAFVEGDDDADDFGDIDFGDFNDGGSASEDDDIFGDIGDIQSDDNDEFGGDGDDFDDFGDDFDNALAAVIANSDDDDDGDDGGDDVYDLNASELEARLHEAVDEAADVDWDWGSDDEFVDEVDERKLKEAHEAKQKREASVRSAVNVIRDAVRRPDTQRQRAVIEAIEQACRLLILLFRSYPELLTDLLTQHALIPLISLVQSREPRVSLAVLQLIKDIVGTEEILNTLCMMGAIPPIAQQCIDRQQQFGVRLQAASVVQAFASSNRQSLQMFAACRGLPVLVELLSIGDASSWQRERPLVELAIGTIADFFSVAKQVLSHRGEFFNVLTDSGLLDRLAAALGHLLESATAAQRQLREQGGADAGALEHALDVIDRALGICHVLSNADVDVKLAMCQSNIVRTLIDVLTSQAAASHRDIAVRVLKIVRALAVTDEAVTETLEAFVVTLVEFIAPFVERGEFVREIHNQVIHTLFNLLRMKKSRQEKAAEAGSIKFLQSVVAMSDYGLRDLAVPMMCDLASASSRTRTLLYEHRALDDYLQLLTDRSWHVEALKAVTEWFEAQPNLLTEPLVQPANTEKIVGVFALACETHRERSVSNLTELIRKMFAASRPLLLHFASEPTAFLARTIFALDSPKINAHARSGLLKLYEKLHAVNPRVTDQQGVRRVIQRIANSKTSPLSVRVLAQNLLDHQDQ
jgi:serine/threonine protein kinase